MLKITKFKIIVLLIFIAVSALILFRNEFPQKSTSQLSNFDLEFLNTANIKISAKNLPKLPSELPIYEYKNFHGNEKDVASAILGKDYFQSAAGSYSNDFYELKISGAVMEINLIDKSKSTKTPSMSQAKTQSKKWLEEYKLLNKSTEAMSGKTDSTSKSVTINYSDLISNFEILDSTLNITVDSKGVTSIIARNWSERDYVKVGDNKVNVKSIEVILHDYSKKRSENIEGPPAPLEITSIDFGYATSNNWGALEDGNLLYPALKINSSIGIFYLQAN